MPALLLLKKSKEKRLNLFACFQLLKFTRKLYNQKGCLMPETASQQNNSVFQFLVTIHTSFQLLAAYCYIAYYLTTSHLFYLLLIQVTELCSYHAASAFFFINASKEPEANRKKRI